MWGVFLCGCTDCFLHSFFFSEEAAKDWAKENSKNPEGYIINYIVSEDIEKVIKKEEDQ